MPIRIVIVDDHRVLRDGLRTLLTREPNFEVVGEAGDGRSVVESVRQTSPDLVLMDLNLPDMTGIVCTQRILAERPGTKVLVLSGDPDLSHVPEALQAGAAGYVLKEETTVELVRAIHSVMNGEAHLSASATTALVGGLFRETPSPVPTPVPRLSEREIAVLKLVIDGLRNKEVAARLGVSVKSVETYRARLMTKLGCSTTAELVRHAIRAGLVEL